MLSGRSFTPLISQRFRMLVPRIPIRSAWIPRTAVALTTFGWIAIGMIGRPAMGADDDTGNNDARPNIVVLLCDDLGYGDLACFGHPHIETPHLDALAAGGIRLTACYSAAPVCSPSRVGLLTGRSPNRAGVYDWIPHAQKPQPDRRDQVHLRRGEVTIAQCLQAAGYQTAMAGKWHCNSKFNRDAQPQPGDFGFDHWLATQNNASPSHKNPKNYVRNGQKVGAVQRFSCQYVIDEAIGFVANLDTDRPFFLYLPFHEPHEPVASPSELVDRYREVAESETQAEYFANVHNVDLAVGRLVDDLRQRDLLDNTLIVFTSDNGPETLNRYPNADRSHGTPGPLRGMKLHTTEAGFRVPGLIHWPARVKSGQTIDAPVSALDFLPTMVPLADGVLPDRPLDGTDLSPLLDGESFERKQPLLWAYYNAINERQVAMRTGPYKVLARIDDAGKQSNLTAPIKMRLESAKLVDFQIFDVTQDIGESQDLSGDDPQRTDRLTSQLKQQYAELLSDSPTW